MTGLGIRDYDHEMHKMSPFQKCEDVSGPFRTIDGTCNNADNLGAANTRLKRLLPPVYDDGQLRQLRNVTSSKIMCLTVEPVTQMQLNAFVETGPINPSVPCDQLVGDLARDFLDLRDFVVDSDCLYCRPLDL